MVVCGIKMKRLVCFSSGSLYVSTEKSDFHRDIKKCFKLRRTDGVEILFAEATKLIQFKFDKSELDFLRGLKFKTIHAPFYFNAKHLKARYNNSPVYKKLLKKLYRLYDQIECDNINIHPHQIRSYKIFNTKDYQHSIENATPRQNFAVGYYRKILKNNTNFKFVLDTTHALAGGELKKLAKEFKKDIIYCHLSAFENERLHLFLHATGKRALKELNPVKKLNCPVVSETWTEDPKLKPHQKEIDFARRWIRE